MKRMLKTLCLVLCCIIILAVIGNIYAHSTINKQNRARNVVTGRITEELNALSGTLDADALTDRVFYSRRQEWESLYGRENCPTGVRIIPLDGKVMINADRETQINGIYTDGVLTAVAEYSFSDPLYTDMLRIMNISFAVCAAFILILIIWLYIRILIPLRKLSDYPEKLSKGIFTEKLTAEKNSIFARYIWGMNMLADKLDSDRQTLGRLSAEREQTVTALVHGIKTPAASIKLLSEAISTGLYSPDGSINETDAHLAGKIEKNPDEIEHLVNRVIDERSTAIIEYDPDKQPFYTSRIEKQLCEEYKDRLSVGRIPFTVKRSGDPIVNSDLDGVLRIMRQLMDNAIKYGDGTGIVLTLEKNEEGHFFTVSNSGTPLQEQELPFVFKSMWRGSNSSDVSGSGIGLFEARFIARQLGGDIRMRTEGSMTEVTVFIPLR